MRVPVPMRADPHVAPSTQHSLPVEHGRGCKGACGWLRVHAHAYGRGRVHVLLKGPNPYPDSQSPHLRPCLHKRMHAPMRPHAPTPLPQPPFHPFHCPASVPPPGRGQGAAAAVRRCRRRCRLRLPLPPCAAGARGVMGCVLECGWPGLRRASSCTLLRVCAASVKQQGARATSPSVPSASAKTLTARTWLDAHGPPLPPAPRNRPLCRP